MYHTSNADVTGQPQGLFPVFGHPWSLLLHNQDSGFSCHCRKDALRRIANQLDVMTQTSGTPQASQGMPLQIGYLLCFADNFFFRLGPIGLSCW